MLSVADALSTLLLRLWPERRHRERLLDLGERKPWTVADRDAALGRLSEWLVRELLLPARLDHAAAGGPLGLPNLSGAARDGACAVLGVGRRAVALARLVGTEPKTLANSLVGGLRSDRRDHRWLLFLSRLERAEVDSDTLVFHGRSPTAVAREVVRGALRSAPDAGDAMLMLSLVSLWQRRRPTSEARAARAVARSRRLVAKPAVAMKWDVIALAQVLLSHPDHP